MYGEDDAAETRRRAHEEQRERADRLYAGDWLGGRLLAHGKAPYRFEPGADESYFVRLQTTEGRQVLWGKDLERAIQESKSHAKVGDAVGVRITYRDKIMVTRANKPPELRTFNRWQIDRAIDIVRERRVAREILEHPITARRAAKDGPAVTGSYLLTTAAEMLARVQFTDERDRKKFVERIREAAGMKPAPDPMLEPHRPNESRSEERGSHPPMPSPSRQGFTRE
jgi:hypothetical protein